jgi:rubredoxin
MRNATSYHPDPEINAELIQQANEAEAFDLSIGYPPRWWTCPECGVAHNRGHFQAIGQHRCLSCGYVGAGGVMRTNPPGTSQ